MSQPLDPPVGISLDPAEGQDWTTVQGIVATPGHSDSFQPLTRGTQRGETVWVVARLIGQYVNFLADGPVGHPVSYNLLGIFPDKDDAVACCTEPRDFIGPVPFGIALPAEVYEWAGVEYPLMPTGATPHE